MWKMGDVSRRSRSDSGLGRPFWGDLQMRSGAGTPLFSHLCHSHIR